MIACLGLGKWHDLRLGCGGRPLRMQRRPGTNDLRMCTQRSESMFNDCIQKKSNCGATARKQFVSQTLKIACACKSLAFAGGGLGAARSEEDDVAIGALVACANNNWVPMRRFVMYRNSESGSTARTKSRKHAGGRTALVHPCMHISLPSLSADSQTPSAPSGEAWLQRALLLRDDFGPWCRRRWARSPSISPFSPPGALWPSPGEFGLLQMVSSFACPVRQVRLPSALVLPFWTAPGPVWSRLWAAATGAASWAASWALPWAVSWAPLPLVGTLRPIDLEE